MKLTQEPFLIRKATSDDIVSLTHLVNILGYETTHIQMRRRYLEISKQKNYQTFIATDQGLARGMIAAVINNSYVNDDVYVRIIAFSVDPAWQKKKIGTSLLKSVESWAKEVNACQILVNCGNRKERALAHAFYLKRDFQEKSIGYSKSLPNP